MRADEPGALTDAELLERSCPSPGNREGKGGLALLLAPTLGSLVSAAPGGTRGAVIWHLLDRTQTNSQQARSFQRCSHWVDFVDFWRLPFGLHSLPWQQPRNCTRTRSRAPLRTHLLRRTTERRHEASLHVCTAHRSSSRAAQARARATGASRPGAWGMGGACGAREQAPLPGSSAGAPHAASAGASSSQSARAPARERPRARRPGSARGACVGRTLRGRQELGGCAAGVLNYTCRAGRVSTCELKRAPPAHLQVKLPAAAEQLGGWRSSGAAWHLSCRQRSREQSTRQARKARARGRAPLRQPAGHARRG